MKVFTSNAFASVPEGGNPAGICLETEGLTEGEMQAIAAEVGYSETAFIFPSDSADFKVRFFTPASEVDLCGHATIATFSLMHELGMIGKGTYRQETAAGILAIEIDEEGTVMMEQLLPRFGGFAEKDLIARSLGISSGSIVENLPVQAVSTGLMDLIVPVLDLSAMESIKPDFSLISEISRDLNVTGYHVFTTETLYGSTAHCRNFAPLFDINEEAATGTATGATVSYMHSHGMLDGSVLTNLKFEQGYEMNRPSEIKAVLGTEGKRITDVRVGGTARRSKTLHL
ncbi:PhzF family phenazine biosynthesis protein [Spirochaeta isovalerica]|uniref:PhzF family phenazine biosynthesis protein n=1 Tax=Spirochaeta isovalerica TaxID=150 RepID=A0A841RBP1_9SPIO|nr:PhzF family phenazine biosynthesis protein [Spirochaeta isovalerica]MBB6480430.1 PhzF family phenazine biosynthesis protein [Spirochaeta isovalerica]